MWEQAKALQEGAEIVVCTPGRLIDHVKKKATNLQRVTYLVFDEADRMFDMGFEYQVRSIANHVRPDRQTLLFSATFRKKIERLARDILIDPIRIVQGDIGEANEDITQLVEILPSGPEKWSWMSRRLVEFTSTGSVLVFVTKKANAEELATNLRLEDHSLGLLHGDMDQSERNKVITDFKKKAIPILVATDVAARGLDIPSIKTVINYDVARDIDTHTHRIGRTGRAGEKGVAYTLLTPKDSNFAGDLVRNLEGANQYVSKELLDLAMQNAWFRKSRFKAGKGKKLNVGGGGLGYRERPGLGADTSERNMTGNVMSNYEAFKPTGGAMGDRLSAMKAAFQSQYKNHFVAASLNTQKTGTSTVNSGAWTSAGSLSSVPSTPSHSLVLAEESAPPPPRSIPGFTSSGTLSSIPSTYAPVSVPSYPAASSQYSAKDSSGGGREGSGSRDRDRYSDGKGRHGEGHRHSDRESHRHGDGHRHSSGGRHGDGRNGDGRRDSDSRREGSREGDGRRESSRDRDDSRRDSHGESRKEGSAHEGKREGSRDRDSDSRRESKDEGESRKESKSESFVVPDPPKRKKSRWDS